MGAKTLLAFPPVKHFLVITPLQEAPLEDGEVRNELLPQCREQREALSPDA